ncbi:MAG: Na/Pi cotransporter family protein [Phycisphaeraceae bacterium]
MNEVILMLLQVIGGLGLFMLGMKYMSEGMQAVAGNSLRRMISMVTDNRLLATATGTGVTLLVQSSSISTVIMVGLVNAGLMRLHQAVGFIMGANIGTTITGWILVIKIGKYGLPILGAAALIYLFTRRDRLRFVAMAIMGLGMVFYGLDTMGTGVAPMKHMPVFIDAFAWFDATGYNYLGILMCIVVGCLLTFLVQSSSATLGITIALAMEGVIPFETAAALVLGENIGTTITIFLAAVGATTNAKRAAYAHVLFNIFGVTWICVLFPWYSVWVANFIGYAYGQNPMHIELTEENALAFASLMTAAIALVHTGFNVTNTLLFLPFLGPFTRLLERLVPEPGRKETAHLRHLDTATVDAPVMGVEQSRGEVVQMGRGCVKMMDWIRQLGFNGPVDERLIQKAFHREEVLDNIEQEIVTFLTDLMDANLPHAVAEEGREQLRMAHEYESISDALASVLKSYLKLRDLNLELDSTQQKDLLALHDEVAGFVKRIADAYEHRQTVGNAEAEQASAAITRQVKQLRDEHLQRMTESQINANLSLIYTTLLTNYRRIKEHALNAHEAAVGGKV